MSMLPFKIGVNLIEWKSKHDYWLVKISYGPQEDDVHLKIKMQEYHALQGMQS